MDIFLKATAGILVAVVLSVILSKQNKDYSLLLVLGVCCMVFLTAMQYLERIIEFLHQLEAVSNVSSDLIEILFKVVGIAMISEITVTICSDAGNSAMGKVIQILSACVNLWICTPLFDQLLELVRTILGAI